MQFISGGENKIRRDTTPVARRIEIVRKISWLERPVQNISNGSNQIRLFDRLCHEVLDPEVQRAFIGQFVAVTRTKDDWNIGSNLFYFL